jgi:phage shock protein C
VNGKRLYRCRQDRQLAGVAGGMAEYLEIDPTVVRILWILSVFLGGFTLLLYVIMAFVVPLEPVGYGAPIQGWPVGPQGPVTGMVPVPRRACRRSLAFIAGHRGRRCGAAGAGPASLPPGGLD